MKHIDRIARAIYSASNTSPEGPYGLYDFSNTGAEMPHRVRIFIPQSLNYGSSVFMTGDREEARLMHEKLTSRHIAYAVLEELKNIAADLADESISRAILDLIDRIDKDAADS